MAGIVEGRFRPFHGIYGDFLEEMVRKLVNIGSNHLNSMHDFATLLANRNTKVS